MFFLIFSSTIPKYVAVLKHAFRIATACTIVTSLVYKDIILKVWLKETVFFAKKWRFFIFSTDSQIRGGSETRVPVSYRISPHHDIHGFVCVECNV